MASAVPPVPLNNAKGMSEVARLALMHASALEQRDAGIINEMASKWVHIQKGLEGQVNKVAQEIAALQAQGKPVTQAWLNELSYYKQLEEQAKNAALGYVNWAQTYTQHQMLQTMAIGMDNATGMLNAGRTKAMDYFRGLPKTQVEAIQSLLMADAPLDKLFNSIIPGGSNLIGNALMQGLSWGMPNKEIAKLMSNAAAIPYNRSLLITRTEINRAYRASTLYTYQKYGVVGKYKRMCSRRHACMACQLLDGTVYPANIPLSDHPNGACTMVPWVNGMNEPMWETGTERFLNMNEEQQRAQMGNNYYDAWKRGDFQLKDMVQMHHSPTWGDSPGLVPLGKLSPNWKSYAAGKAQQPAAAVTQAANLFANPLSLKDRQYYKDLFEDLRFEGTGMAERQLKQNAAAIMNLSDSDKKAFRNYTGSGYHDMNAAGKAQQ